MDAQGRGRDDIDPADQWVLNPQTGDYELRLSPSTGQSAPPGVPGPRGAAPRPPGRASERPGGRERGREPGRGQGREHGRRHGSEPGATGSREHGREQVPGQRRRRGAQPEPTAGGRRKQRPKKKNTGKKIAIWTGGTVAFVVVVAAVGGYLYYQHLNDNITAVSDDGAGTGGFSKDRAINILLVGTDKRSGSGNKGYGDEGSVGHADTTLLLHVSKDRSNATALSIPRDMITDIPDCPTKQDDGSMKTIPGSQQVRFNESLGQSERTPSCVMRTVTKITGIKLDHFMVADFNAVKTLSSAVDGVDVCLAKDIDDPKSHLKLSKGEHTIEGEEALAFVRTRHTVGNGGDLSRIELQQQFLSSLMRKLKSGGTLTSPKKMISLAEAGTKALTVDSKIADIMKLRDLGMELGKLDMKNLTFATTPVDDNPAEPTPVTVVLNKAKSDKLFSMMREDVSLTEVKKKEKKEKAAVAARLKGPKADPADVRVDIYNGSGKTGAAQATLAWLQNTEGVTKSSQLGNAPKNLGKTTLEYGKGEADQARRLAQLMGLPGAALKQGKSEKNAQGLPAMVLTLGADFKGAGEPISAPSKAPDGIQKVGADKTVCAK
ncbi:LCP family protein [Streptomyces flavofungini]|uniref:LCP family protein n=1 Tax=Streptomyces flavofungini TaxID=68200 RepID=A0ABS0XCD8_9ACTN|nr:LCP family protein [Streptomyces flavofungini]MBJ3810880.1 LCP family protein [Streptomyces flavofungini]GHC62784.1 LytR family transcriptional regulator [Streptomyces flavofungini]